MLADVESKDWTAAVTMEAGIQSDNKLFYFAPTFHFEECFQKVCSVGLLFTTGINMTPWAAFEYSHHSRHSADRLNSSESDTRYPLFDAVGLRLRFVQ